MRHVDEARNRRNEKLRQTRGRQTMTLLSVVLACVAVVTIGYFVFNSDIWLLKTITVAGNERLSTDEVVSLAGVDHRTSLLKLPADRISADLKRNPWVESVTLSRGLPNRLTIEIRERRPFVGIKQAGKLMIADDKGFVVQSLSVPATNTTMPVISDISVGKLKVGRPAAGRALPAAIKSYKALDKKIRARVIWISVPSTEKLTFQTSDGLEIVYGSAEESAKKNFVLNKVLEQSTGKVVHVNVTAPTNPVVRKLKSE